MVVRSRSRYAPSSLTRSQEPDCSCYLPPAPTTDSERDPRTLLPQESTTKFLASEADKSDRSLHLTPTDPCPRPCSSASQRFPSSPQPRSNCPSSIRVSAYPAGRSTE